MGVRSMPFFERLWHPRLLGAKPQVVDARDKPGHDGRASGTGLPVPEKTVNSLR